MPENRWRTFPRFVTLLSVNSLPSIAEMERACQAGDATYNGVFFFGVRTTGVFCRPQCPARKPKPENVEYFPSARAALVSGYRPCKRCRPLESADQPPWAADLLAEIEENPTARIDESALRARGIDPGTVRRHFLRRYGLTFHAFARARRLSGVFHSIQNGATIDDAVFESGYESHSGFRDAFARLFGAPPGDARDRDCISLTWVETPLGPMIAGATADGVCLLEFSDRRMIETQIAVLRQRFQCAVVPGTNPHLDRLRLELGRYFAGDLRTFSVPLLYPGSDFQRRVWDALLEIPYGRTLSYQELARAVGDGKAVRAVGRANGLNRIAIVIPCHRVINKGGALGGYGGGLHRKQYLLDLERGRPHEAQLELAPLAGTS
jgi:AraC family transcriptional regulator of adaptative response/methylated-DNA-[protein]-cysteine methyltransferase